MATPEMNVALRAARIAMVERVLAAGGGLAEVLAEMPDGFGGSRPGRQLRRHLRDACGRPDLAERISVPVGRPRKHPRAQRFARTMARTLRRAGKAELARLLEPTNAERRAA